MLELIIGACAITILLVSCNRKGGVLYNKQRIETVMHHLNFLTRTCDGSEFGKYIAYTYRNKNNDKYLVSTFNSVMGLTYYIYRWDGEEYKYVAKWQYHQFNFIKINNICFANSFDIDDLVKWATDY